MRLRRAVYVLIPRSLRFMSRLVAAMGRRKWEAFVLMKGSFLGLEVLFAGPNFDIQRILFRRKDTDELIVVDTGGMIGHVEV